ncbi:MAG: MFS transporter, partial [Bryobacteraceae bacterium]
LAMGIAGAGNSGTLLSTLFAPRLAAAFGWQAAFGFAVLPVAIVMALFALLAKDSPNRPPVVKGSQYLEVLRESDTGWFCVLYCMTFGGFVGLASYLTVFFHAQYGLTKVQAGDFTTLAVLAGSFLRPVGGMISDLIGGYRLLLLLLTGAGLCLAVVGMLPSASVALGLLVATMGLLGMGNGAVFQMLPQRFPDRTGMLTGIVGAAGGIGGFLLPSLLGIVKDRTGQYGLGFFLCASAMLGAAVILLHLGQTWLETWNTKAASRAGVFSYRSKPDVSGAAA